MKLTIKSIILWQGNCYLDFWLNDRTKSFQALEYFTHLLQIPSRDQEVNSSDNQSNHWRYITGFLLLDEYSLQLDRYKANLKTCVFKLNYSLETRLVIQDYSCVASCAFSVIRVGGRNRNQCLIFKFCLLWPLYNDFEDN